MLTKLAIGTANFIAPYGIMSQGTSISVDELKKIFTLIDSNGVDTFDSALGYGDLFSLGSSLDYDFSKKKVTTKFSLLENFDLILEKLKSFSCKYYSLLVHDPSNLSKIDRIKFLSFVEKVKSLNICEKVGLSVYDFEDLKSFQDFFTPEIIQIPLNPLNQRFLENDFADYAEKHSIEVHARSLFLQGILLADTLPDQLLDIKKIWARFVDICSDGNSRLEVLLNWACSKKLVSKWILGVSCAQDLQEILSMLKNLKISDDKDLFEEFKSVSNSLVDPRNWKNV